MIATSSCRLVFRNKATPFDQCKRKFKAMVNYFTANPVPSDPGEQRCTPMIMTFSETQDALTKVIMIYEYHRTRNLFLETEHTSVLISARLSG